MPLPPINPEHTNFTVWRWRTDVRRWVKVSTQPTLDDAIARRDEEVGSIRYTKRPTCRITRDTVTREEVTA